MNIFLGSSHRQLLKIALFLDKYGLVNESTSLMELTQRSQDGSFNIAIIGAYNRGKSTLINALMGDEILPSANRPTTKCVTYIQRSKMIGVTLSGETERTYFFSNTQELRQFLLVTFSGESSPNEITIYYPHPFSKKTVIIDTPGTDDAYEITTYDFLRRNKIDGVVLVFGVREQVKHEVDHFRSLALHYPIFCVLNQIDQANSQSDLEQNISYFTSFLDQERSNVEFTTVSAYLGLRGQQWQRSPTSFESIRAQERSLKMYSEPKEMLRESQFLEMRSRFQQWLARRKTHQEWRKVCLARNHLATMQDKASQETLELQKQYDQTASPILERLTVLEQEQRQLQLHHEKTDHACSDMLDQAWNEMVANAIVEQRTLLRSSISTFLSETRPTDLKKSVLLKIETDWQKAYMTLEQVVMNQSHYVHQRLQEKVNRHFTNESQVSTLVLRMPHDIQHPQRWQQSTNVPIARLLADIPSPEAPGTIGGALRMAVDVWKSRLNDKVRKVFEQELELHVTSLQKALAQSWYEWHKTLQSDIRAIYLAKQSSLDHEYNHLKQQFTSLEKARQQQQMEFALIAQESKQFNTRLNKIERSFVRKRPARSMVSLRGLRYIMVITLVVLMIVITSLSIFDFTAYWPFHDYVPLW